MEYKSLQNITTIYLPLFVQKLTHLEKPVLTGQVYSDFIIFSYSWRMRTTHFQCLPLKTLLLCILSFLVPARPHVITDFFGWEGISIYVLYCRGQKSA